jgi:NADH-quinone oxidoreductase subunit E
MLSTEALRRIDRELAKYPPDRRESAVMAALAIAQDEKGPLTPELMAFVAEYLRMPPVAVEEVATFYTMYDLAPVGKYKLCVCTNLPCALRGATEAVAHLQKKLGIGLNETTPDGQFTLKEGECFGACGDAPVMLVNNRKMVSFMTPEALDRYLAELAK